MADLARLGIEIDSSQADAGVRSLDNLAAASGRAATAAKATGAATTEHAAATRGGVAATLAAAEALAAAERAHRAHGNAVGFNRMQMMETTHVARAMFDTLAAGGSPMRAFGMEAGRISQILAQGGGLANGIKAIAGPVGAVAAAVIAGASAWSVYESRLERAQIALNGLGRASGLTLAGLSAVGEGIAGRSNISIAAGQNIAATYAGAGLNGSQIESLGAVTKQYGRAFGMSLDDSAKDLSKVADPMAGANELNKKLGFMSGALQHTIEKLTVEGDIRGAQNAVIAATNEALRTTVDRASIYVRTWESATNAMSNWTTKAGASIDKMVSGDSPENRVAKLEKELAEIRKSGGKRIDAVSDFQFSKPGMTPGGKPGMFNLGDMPTMEVEVGRADAQAKLIASKEREIAITNQEIAGNTELAAIKERNLELDRRSIAARSIIDANVPEHKAREGLETDAKALKELQGQFGRTGYPASVLSTAIERAGAKLAAFMTPLEKIAHDSAVSTQLILSQTAAQRARIEADRDYQRVLTETGDKTRAAAEAQRTYADAVAASQKKLTDLAREVGDKSGLSGASWYEREQRRLAIDIRETNRGIVSPGYTPPGGAAANDNAGHGTGNAGANGSIVAYIRQRAVAEGIDPDIAVRVARSEGLGSYVGDKGTSFGPFQLHYGGLQPGALGAPGLGDRFTRDTGLDARDKSTVHQQVDYALAEAAKRGWGQWYGAARVGIGNRDGIGGQPGQMRDLVVRPGGAGGDRVPDNAEGRRSNELLSAERIKNQLIDPLGELDRQMTSNERSLRLEKELMGASVGAVAEYMEKQKLLNQAVQNGIPLTGKLGEEVEKYIAGLGKRAGELAELRDKQQRDARKNIENADFVRSTANDLLSSPLLALAHGQSPMEALKGAGRRLGDNLINKGTSLLTSTIFGDMGTNLFGGDKTTGSMDVQAGVVNVNGGAGGAPGGGGIMGALARAFGFGGVGGADQHGGDSNPGGAAGAPMQLPGAAFADGTDFFAGGSTLVGERGPEVVNLPRGSQIVPNAIAAQGGGMNYTGGDFIVQGSINEDVLPKVQQMLAVQQAQTVKELRRNLGVISGQHQRLYGA